MVVVDHYSDPANSLVPMSLSVDSAAQYNSPGAGGRLELFLQGEWGRGTVGLDFIDFG